MKPFFYTIVRIVDEGGFGDLASKGRVEVHHNGAWKTVCDVNWDLRDANVVCRQLGFAGAVAANKSAAFGQGEGKIWMYEVQCTGNESSFKECNHQGWAFYYCSHREDAGVMCTTGDKYTIVAFGVCYLYPIIIINKTNW